MLRVTAIKKFEEFLALKDIWNDLIDRSRERNVFLTHDWLRCWWKGYGNGKNIFILLVSDFDGPVGIAPLMISKEIRRNIPIRRLGFIENQEVAHMDFIVPRKREEILKSPLHKLNLL